MMKKSLTPVARKLRNNSTLVERSLWQVLRNKGIGVKFRRQAIIGPYVVDFACFQNKLVIEIDGGQHCDCVEDKIRDEWLSSQGFKVLRFWNNEVIENMEGVFQKIQEHVISPSHPSPTRGEG